MKADCICLKFTKQDEVQDNIRYIVFELHRLIHITINHSCWLSNKYYWFYWWYDEICHSSSVSVWYRSDVSWIGSTARKKKKIQPKAYAVSHKTTHPKLLVKVEPQDIENVSLNHSDAEPNMEPRKVKSTNFSMTLVKTISRVKVVNTLYMYLKMCILWLSKSYVNIGHTCTEKHNLMLVDQTGFQHHIMWV